jgi:hypothetical protein
MADDKKAHKAQQAFDAASNNVRRNLTTSNGGAKAEKAYADTYSALVSLGLKPKLRKKYRSK